MHYSKKPYNRFYSYDAADYTEYEEQVWTDEDEAGLEEHEERRRQSIAERNEY